MAAGAQLHMLFHSDITLSLRLVQTASMDTTLPILPPFA